MGGWREVEGVAVEEVVVVVAVDASKEITDYALEWAIRNVVKPTDLLLLLALLPSSSSGPLVVSQSLPSNNRNNQSRANHFITGLLKKWGLRNDSGVGKETSMEVSSQGSGNGMAEVTTTNRINEVCVEMMNELCWANNVKKVQTQVELIPNARIGSVANKAEELGARWIILDRRLKKESESCLRQLSCNIILVDHAIPKVLQLINVSATEEESHTRDMFPLHRTDDCTSTSSQGLSSPGSSRTNISSSFGSSTDRDVTPSTTLTKDILPTRPHHQNIQMPGRQRRKIPAVPRPTSSTTAGVQLPHSIPKQNNDETFVKSPDSVKDSRNKNIAQQVLEKLPIAFTQARRSLDSRSMMQSTGTHISEPKPLMFQRNFKASESEGIVASSPPTPTMMDRTSSVRRAMSLSIKKPPNPPPLCSVCKHKAPVFGKPPTKFSYQEMEMATDGFSSNNFLAEGGYGPVYKGVLPDGQAVAVKRHKSVSAQGASEFCAEVEVLSCAQHRNLVMLVGYCMDREWLLVYEFACNGSLDKHLYDQDEKRRVMTWHDRHKVAVGAARALRYLHEDCRVGCIVHRDLRANNILLTHDFEPMVGDFGLARWQSDGQSAEETRIVGTFGYLAPEYTQTGQITEKADVYAFGVLLMELISGVKGIDLARCTGKQFLSQWARPLMDRKMINGLIDPRLEGNYVQFEADCMMYAASLCISLDSEMRPRMSKILKILEGDIPNDSLPINAHLQHTQSPITSYPSLNTTPRPADALLNRNAHQIPHTPYRTSSLSPIDEYNNLAERRYISPLRNDQVAERRYSSPLRNDQVAERRYSGPWVNEIAEGRYSSPLLVSEHRRSNAMKPPPTSVDEIYVVERARNRRIMDQHDEVERARNKQIMDQHDEVERARNRQIMDQHDEVERARNRRIMDQHEHLATEEYQAYLQGSLAEFIHNTKTRTLPAEGYGRNYSPFKRST